MSELAELLRNPPVLPDEDNAKRRQIVDGARQIFLARGFDAASMMEIAKAAGVSKGTLYVYFKNKEELFAAIVQQECGTHAEGAFALDANDHDVETVLTRLGIEFVKFLCNTGKASSLRIVIAIADRMPEIGKAFYETGPAEGIARLGRVPPGMLERAAQTPRLDHPNVSRPIHPVISELVEELSRLGQTPGP